MKTALALAVTLVSVALADKPWMDTSKSPKQRAQILVSKMTPSEKRGMLYGYGCQSKEWPYVGNVAGIERLGIPPLKYNDGPQGFRDDALPGTTTAWPSGLTAAASWDHKTMFNWGTGMGKEFYRKGANVQLGPGVCVARIPRNGRNFEYLSGEDPYLGYTLVQPAVQGIQSQGVVANVKHYVNNNQETNRGSVSENVDERTRFEMYYPPFQGGVDASVGSMMCSYNKINHVYSCENPETLAHDLKQVMGFEGYVMSDWGATHSLSIAQGLDQEMPSSNYFNQSSLQHVDRGRVDDSVTRILTPLFQVGIMDKPNENSISNNATDEVQNSLCRQISENSTILLQNKDDVLPLPKSNVHIAVVGNQAWNAVVHGGGSGQVIAAWVEPPLWAICDELGIERVNGNDGESKCNSATGACVTYYDGKSQPPSDFKFTKALVFIQTSSHEGADRTNLTFGNGQDAMVDSWSKLAGVSTVVVMSTPGAVLTPWSDRVESLLLNFMPGQAFAGAISNVLFGNVSPSGKLPLTFPNSENEQKMTTEQYPGLNNGENATYSETFYFGYRWYDKHQVEPKFPFGHGLSYTKFSYSKDLKVSGRSVEIEVENSGQRDGAEVVQLYLGFPSSAGEPLRQLKGFRKVHLSPGQKESVVFNLTDRDVSIWDVETHSFTVEKGTFEVFVGSSSRQFEASGKIEV